METGQSERMAFERSCLAADVIAAEKRGDVTAKVAALGALRDLDARMLAEFLPEAPTV